MNAICNQWRTLSAIVTALVLATAASLAAPMLPERSQLPAPIRSLRAVKEIRVDIGPVPPEFVDAGLTQQGLAADWRKRLTEAGFTVVEGEDAPTLSLGAFIVLDSDVPDARGYVFYVALHQPVNVLRLDEVMPLPTYTEFNVGVENEASMANEIRDGVAKLLANFIERAELAGREP